MGTTTTLVTVQEFLQLPEIEGQRMELIGGEVVTMGRGGRSHEFVKSNIAKLLFAWLLQNRPGRVLLETGFQVDNYDSLIPDLSYVSKDPGAPGTTGLIQGAPDLAVEVVSSEAAARLSKKVALYPAHGGKSVWVVYPEEQKVSIHVPGQAKEFQRDHEIEDPILPGFRASVSAIFEGI